MINDLKAHLEKLAEMGITEIQAPKSSAKESDGLLRTIRNEIGDCQRCPLSKGRTQIVFGVGDPHARLMFIGEAPGRDEDLQGEPFVGRAGQLLTKMIEAMGLKRSEVYIANIVKCRPPDNRYPEPVEVETCIPFLHRQIEAIRPEILVTLGNLATQTLLQIDAGITTTHGRFHDLNGIRVMPIYHPAYLLRNPNMKRPAWEDLQKVMATLGLQAR